MSQSDDEQFDIIHKQFPLSTRIFYPFRPILTLSVGLTLIGLGYAGLVTLSTATYLGSTIISDDLILYPAFSFYTLGANLQLGIKHNKSRLRILATILGYVLGFLLAYGFLVANPMFLAITASVTAAMGCHLTTIAVMQIAGAAVAHYFHKSAILGMLVGAIIAPLLPISLPLAIDVIGLSVLSCGFLANYLIKQLLRAYYWLRYGHSNADGYHFAHAPHPLPVDSAQAEKFAVTADVFTGFRKSLIQVIRGSKANTSYLGQIFGTGKACTDEFKNILHQLMMAKSAEDRDQLKSLLEATQDFKNVDSKNLPDNTGLVFDLYTGSPNADDLSDTGFALASHKQNQAFKLKQNTAKELHEELLTLHQFGIMGGLARCGNKGECHKQATRDFIESLASMTALMQSRQATTGSALSKPHASALAQHLGSASRGSPEPTSLDPLPPDGRLTPS